MTRILVIPLLALSLSGCVISVNSDDDYDIKDWRQKQERNERVINHLRLGQDIHVVEDELGEPDFTEAFQRDGEAFTVLYYRTRRVHDDGKTTKDETTPVVFVSGELVGWGESAVEHATHR